LRRTVVTFLHGDFQLFLVWLRVRGSRRLHRGMRQRCRLLQMKPCIHVTSSDSERHRLLPNIQMAVTNRK